MVASTVCASVAQRIVHENLEGALEDFYGQEVLGDDYSLKYGFSYSRDGKVAAGFRIASKYGEKVMPVAFSVASNVKDLIENFKFEVGSRFSDSLSAVLYGDRNGLKWLSSVWLPVENHGPINGVGMSLEGSRANPVAITGGLGIMNRVFQARVTFDDRLEPTGTNIIVLTRRSEQNQKTTNSSFQDEQSNEINTPDWWLMKP